MVEGFKVDDGHGGKRFVPTEKNNSSLSSKDVKSNDIENTGVDHAGAKKLKEEKMKDMGITISTRQEGFSKEIADREYDRFLQGLTDYGSSDIATAVEKFGEVGLYGNELADVIREFSDDVGTPLADVDIASQAYEHILQMARSEIDRVIGYDFINDFNGDTGIYTAGNYMATSYDYSQEAVDELQKKIRNASNGGIEQLGESRFVLSLLDALDIELSNKGGNEDDDEG